MLITLGEIIKLAIMSFVLGWIFSGIFGAYFPRKYDNLPENFQRASLFDWESIKIGTLIAAPGVVLHELMHKFVAMAFGAYATFEISTFGLSLGVILKLVGAPFLVIVPGFVRIMGQLSPIQLSLIAFAGPLANLILYFVCKHYSDKVKSRNTRLILAFSARLNLFLFFFNMIPIPPFDGYQVFAGLFEAIKIGFF
ncbi:MAG TPA: M50 family peptidase [Candidatus Woesearchaeota archaeon]|nr:M50 family peptidase [Candidatus Woesearchaeota archaeon]